MTLHDFLHLEGEFSFSADDVAGINRELATKKVSDIALGDRQKVLDYLRTAMQLNSVEHGIRAKIDDLIADLQSHWWARRNPQSSANISRWHTAAPSKGLECDSWKMYISMHGINRGGRITNGLPI
ncbi:hypothetical protein ACI2J5_18990 [Agrobacterium pusense]|uniref:hypothetical protein n=1 Tax=Agrobacterium pusense TaxID=648995 RepID=UPI00384EE55C